MDQRVEWLELRPAAARPVATGSLACPGCDAPTSLGSPVRMHDHLTCGYCGRAGAVRDFLSLGEPSRPARVVLHVR